MFGKSKKSILLLLTFFFWVGYVTFTGYQFYSQASKLTDHLIQSRQSNLDYILQSSVGSLIGEHPESLKDKLTQARKLGFVDFFILQKGAVPLFFENNSGNLDELNHNYVNFNTFIETNGLKFKTIKVQDYRLTAGIFSDRGQIILHTFIEMLPLFLKDILIVTGLLALIAYSLLKDFMNLSKVLASRNRAQVLSMKAHSQEADTLLKASAGLEGERLRLEKLSEIYGATVGPAIRYELKSGKEAPYSFSATLCRVDLNGYTQIFLEKNDTYLVGILNNYFSCAREIIERYDGLIYQFVGDEIVFLFKDDISPQLSTESLAVACIRDLFSQAAHIERNLPEEANHYFKLKGSFAYGTMRFTSLDEGHAMSGLPLIESVRLLSLIDDKTHQVMAFFNDSLSKAQNLTSVFERQKNQLKGFKEESLICKSWDFNLIERVFEIQNWAELPYFRSDEHLIYVLQKMSLMALSGEDQRLWEVLSNLRWHKSETSSSAVISELELVLSAFIKAEEESLIGAKSLSSLISLIGRLSRSVAVSDGLADLLMKLIHHSNHRVQANAISVLGRNDSATKTIWSKMYSENNRVAADAIMEVAKQQVTSDVWRALQRLLNSPEDLQYRSGEYARKFILAHYHEKDPVFCNTNPILIKMQKWTKEKAA